MKTHIVTLSIIFSHIFATATAGDSYLQKMIEALKLYIAHASQEQVFVEGCRDSYTPGSDIHFSAFVTYKNQPSTLSKIVYAELINDTGKIIQRLTLPVNDGLAYGDFSIADKLAAGRYYIKAYTLWMLNFDAALPFLKAITIDDALLIKEKVHTADFTLLFYPEGGSLVTGLTSQVAFKAVDLNGNPIDIHGTIRDSSGKTVANINSMHDGIGRFMVHVPITGNVYTADVVSVDGTHKLFALPAAKSNGIVLHVQNDFDTLSNKIFYRVSRTKADKDLYQHLFVCINANGQFTFDQISFDSTHAGNDYDTIIYTPSQLNLDKIGTGIVQLTVFNSLNGEALAERLVYYNNAGGIVTPGISNEDLSGQKDTAGIALSLPNNFNGSYAISVTENAMGEEGGNSSLAADVLLSSHVKDTINNAPWYIANAGKQRQQALDVLLITAQSNFNWQQVLMHDTPVIKYPAEQTFAITGHAYTTVKNHRLPFKKGNLSFIVEAIDDSLRDVYNIPVDSTGFFALPGLTYKGTIAIYAQAKEKRTPVSIVFDDGVLDSVKNTAVPKSRNIAYATKPKAVQPTTNNFADSAHSTLAPVTVHARALTRLDSIVSTYVSTPFLSEVSSRTYNLIDEPGSRKYSQNIIEWIQANAFGVVVETNTNGSGKGIIIDIYWRLIHGGQSKKINRPQIYLDELPLDYMSAISLLQDLKVSDAALVKAYPPGSFSMVSGNAPNGAIAVYSKKNKGAMFEQDVAAHLNKTTRQGYSLTKPLPYTSEANNDVLYFNTSLNAGSTNPQHCFVYYDADKTRPRRIRVEGIGTDGSILFIDKLIP